MYPRFARIVIIAVLGFAAMLDAGTVYIGGRWSIARADLDGQNLVELVPEGTAGPGTLAIDAEGGKLYWLRPDPSAIRRCNLDGTDVETVLDLSPDNEPSGLTLDIANGTLYWTQGPSPSEGYSIQKALLDGTGETFVAGSPDVRLPRQITIDPVTRDLFFFSSDGAYGSKSRLVRMNPGGTSFVTVYNYLDSNVQGLAIDPVERLVYWLERFSPFYWIKRVSVHGGTSELLLTSASTDIEYLNALAIDATDAKLYWGEAGPDFRIRRANTDGTSLEVVIDEETGNSFTPPLSIVVDRATTHGTRSCVPSLRFGDVVGPEYIIDFRDIDYVVRVFEGSVGPDDSIGRADLYPCDAVADRCVGDGKVDFRDITSVVGAFIGHGCP